MTSRRHWIDADSTYGTYRVMGADKPILTLVDSKDWEKSLQYDFTEPQSGLWCHFLTDAELEQIHMHK